MEDPQPWFYLPLRQEFQSLRAIVVRSAVPPQNLITEVEREIRTLALGRPLFNSATVGIRVALGAMPAVGRRRAPGC